MSSLSPIVIRGLIWLSFSSLASLPFVWKFWVPTWKYMQQWKATYLSFGYLLLCLYSISASLRVWVCIGSGMLEGQECYEWPVLWMVEQWPFMYVMMVGRCRLDAKLIHDSKRKCTYTSNIATMPLVIYPYIFLVLYESFGSGCWKVISKRMLGVV